MITRRIASAPGKLVLAGEYAVLEGHPAMVAAVDRRATCSLHRKPCALTVSGLGQGPFSVRDTGTGVEIVGDDHDNFRLLRAVFNEYLQQGLTLPKGQLQIDSSALSAIEIGAESLKLGLGSSAAVAAALICCLAAEAGDESLAQDPFASAYAAHHAFSLGRGSGIDVAAASRGGLVQFIRTEDGPVLKSAPPMPADLAVVVAFCGHSQDTRAFLDQTSALKREQRELYHDCIGEQAEATARIIDALEQKNADDLLLGIDASRQAMQRLGEAASIDIVSAPHRKIASLAAAHGGAAKPSGAGGGDIALAFVLATRRQALEADLRRAGFLPLKLSLGAAGPRSEVLA